MFEQALDTALLTYARARSLGFTLEFLAMNALSNLLPGNERPPLDPKIVPVIQR